MLKEFKEFAMKGNIMDLAIGVVIGGAFQKIVNSLVQDVIMPAISILTGKMDFSNMVLEVGNVSIKYGSFITTIVDFLIIAFSIFLVLRYLNKLNRLKELGDKAAYKLDRKGRFKKKNKNKEETTVVEEVQTTKTCPYCYSEIKWGATRCPYCTSMIKEETEEFENNV